MHYKFQATFDLPDGLDTNKLARLESDLLETCDKIVAACIWERGEMPLVTNETNGFIATREEAEIS